MENLIVYEGNWPSNVSKDAKYSIRSEAGKYVIGIEYRTQTGEKWYPTTANHDLLVEMVNAIKVAVNGSPGGPFYINEYRQVIVPVGNPVTYYYAGDYTGHLLFDFEGCQLSGKGYDLTGGPLGSGSRWEGPHAGIPYKLKAGGRDIYYTRQVRARVKKDEMLSAYVGPERAQQLARKITAIKGFSGGRFYINEFRQLFTPMERETGWAHIYLGALETDDPWFPRPHASGR